MGWRDPLSTPNLTRFLPRALCAAVLLAILKHMSINFFITEKQ
jgi:hypothetical protein